MVKQNQNRGFTKFDNEELEYIAQLALSGTEYQIYLMHQRWTTGWQKSSDTWSVSQMAKAINRSERQVKRSLKRMIEKNIFEQTSNGFLNSKSVCVLDKNVTNLVSKMPEIDSKNGSNTVTGMTHSKERKKKEIKRVSFEDEFSDLCTWKQKE
jgi:phage replication O-like protein O